MGKTRSTKGSKAGGKKGSKGAKQQGAKRQGGGKLPAKLLGFALVIICAGE